MNIVILARAQNDASPTCIYVHEQAKSYAKLGHNVIEICTIPFIPFMKYIRPERYERFKNYKGIKKKDNVTILYVKKLSLSNYVSQRINGYLTYIAIKRKVKKLIIQKNLDILHTHMLEQEGYAGYLLKKSFNIPVIVTSHGTDCFRYFNPNPENYLKKTVLGLDQVVTVSNQLKMTIQDKIPNANIITIYNGTSVLNVAQSSFNKLNLKAQNSIISVGTFLKRKNFDITIKVFEKFSKYYPNATLTLVGEGEEYKYLKSLVNELEISNKVFFTGRLPNNEVIQKMIENEIFLMPSEKEGFGIVYLEAMQCGCIPIALNDAGISDLITNGFNGILLKNTNIDLITNILVQLYKNNQINKIQNECINSSKNYTWEKNAQEYVNLFENIISHRSEIIK